MLTLTKIFSNVIKDKFLDKFSTDDGERYCLHNGCKISKKGGRIKLFNLNTGGGTFAPLSERQILPFRMYGFRAGTEYLRIDNMRTEINLLDMEVKRLGRGGNTPDLLKAKKRRTLLENKLHDEVFEIKRQGY
tara:strand:- start:374 stop:772 length:399 start_codon:yes stop_codon:yes gene_type:complete